MAKLTAIISLSPRAICVDFECVSEGDQSLNAAEEAAYEEALLESNSEVKKIGSITQDFLDEKVELGDTE